MRQGLARLIVIVMSVMVIASHSLLEVFDEKGQAISYPGGGVVVLCEDPVSEID